MLTCLAYLAITLILPLKNTYNFQVLPAKYGAQERTRTFTALRPQVPETCASTNSATWAKGAGALRRDARIYALGGGASRRSIGGVDRGRCPQAPAGGWLRARPGQVTLAPALKTSRAACADAAKQLKRLSYKA